METNERLWNEWNRLHYEYETENFISNLILVLLANY